MRKEENDLIHRGTYDGTIYHKAVSTGESSSPKENKIAPPPQKQTAEPSESLITDGASEVDDMTRNLIASTMAAFRRNS